MMEHHLRILQKNFSDGKMNRQEFRTHIELEFSRLEDALMNDEITPDQHIRIVWWQERKLLCRRSRLKAIRKKSMEW